MSSKQEQDLKAMSQNMTFVGLIMGYGGPIFFFFLGLVLFYFHPYTSLHAIKIYYLFLLYELFLDRVIPGKVEKSIPLIDGTPTQYKINGFRVFVTVILTFFAGGYFELWKLTIIYDNLWDLIIVINTSSFLMSLILYIKGKFFAPPNKIHSEGSFILDMWYGLELNPHILGVDVKFFSEGRPQLIGWVLVGYSIAAKQYERHGEVSHQMILFLVFTTLYAADYFWFEICMTTTWDIIAERFGWMLTWGTWTFYPFFYNIQAFYMLEVGPPINFPLWINALIVAEFVFGFYIFRNANLQKHNFKFNPSYLIEGKKPEVIATPDGKKKLLVSGWWGRSRHPNYLGDILISTGFALPTLIYPSIIPFGQPLFLAGLLFQRFTRDDKKCRISYGKTWDEYTKRVPYKIIPGIY